jgi:hypothetical protein
MFAIGDPSVCRALQARSQNIGALQNTGVLIVSFLSGSPVNANQRLAHRRAACSRCNSEAIPQS